MRWVLMQLNNYLSGRTQSETENSRLERPVGGRKFVLSDPANAKYPRKGGKNRG